MLNYKTLLKVVFGLGVWSILIIGMTKLQDHIANVQDYARAPVSRRLLMQNQSDHFEASAATRDLLFPEDVLIDNLAFDDESLVRDIQFRNPSLPIAYWRKFKNNTQEISKTCAKYPSIFDLEFNNIYWQTLRTTNGTFQLFGAYYDIRKVSAIGPAVRILGMIDRIVPIVKTYCQIWFGNQSEPIIVETSEYTYIWNKKWGNYQQGIYQPYLIACKIPKSFYGIVPASVSIVEKKCDTATNNFRVIYNPAPDEKKKAFAVCVKGLDFLYDDMSVRLVEWIELLNILGAEKIFVYDLHMHPNMTKVLRHYEEEGLVQVTPLTLAGDKPNLPGLQHLYLYNRINHARQTEIIPYNDCLYKNMYMYDFIAVLDIDEVIMPKKDMTWGALMKRLLSKSRLIKNGTFPSYHSRNLYFLDEQQHDHGLYKGIPKYLLMLQHVHRAQHYTKPRASIKCFHNPERVLSLHNHFPLLCLEGRCQSYPIDTEDAHMQHYCAGKKDCEKLTEKSVVDTTIWKYKDELVRRSVRTLDQLGFYGRH